jgi:hypothetical protein
MYNPSMFWITFFVSGLTVASIPWIAGHFNNNVAGYLVLVPVMMTLSIVVQYLAHGQKDTVEMIRATIFGLPTLLVFGLSAIALLKSGLNIFFVITASLVLWFASVIVLNQILTK